MHYNVRRSAVLGLLIVVTFALTGCGGANTTHSFPTASQLQQTLSTAQQQYGVPGMAAAVISSDRVVTAHVGVRVLGNSTPIGDNDLFHLASNIKSMTAMLVAHEVEAGKLQWTTSLAQVFPEFVGQMQPALETATVEQVLEMQSGIIACTNDNDCGALPDVSGTPTEERYQLALWALQQPPTAPPGTQTTYSDGGYLVAGAIIEKVSGQSYESLLQQFLFAPMNMNAKYNWPAYNDPNQPWGHYPASGTDGALVPVDPNSFPLPDWMTPTGNVSLSVEDFARYAQLHLRGLLGEAKLLQTSTYINMHTLRNGYGLGWGAVYDNEGVLVSAHEGGVVPGGFDAWILVQPLKNRAVVLVTNGDSDTVQSGNQKLALQLLDLIR